MKVDAAKPIKSALGIHFIYSLPNLLTAVKQYCGISNFSHLHTRRHTRNQNQKTIFFIFIALLNLPLKSAAYNSCQKIYSQLKNIPKQEQVQTWLRWEQLYNTPEYRRTDLVLPMQTSQISKENFIIENYATDENNDLYDFIYSSGNLINWYKHPTNTSAAVPYFSSPNSNHTINTNTTASRSLSFSWKKSLYSIKLATNHPHEGKYAVDKKATIQEDISVARSRSPYINQTEKLIGLDTSLSIVKEIAVVMDKNSKEGYVIRDLSFLLDQEHYFLPAFSIPYVANEINLSSNAQDRFLFWKKNYAQPLGKAKAKLLLRYGLQMETPNPQNILLELDQNKKPTGKIMFRDISDMALVRAVAFAYGTRKQLAIDLKNGIKNSDSIIPNAELSFLFFDRTELDPMWNKQTISQFIEAHNRSYFEELENELHIDLSEIKETTDFVKLYIFFQSAVGQELLRQYRQKQIHNHDLALKPKAVS